MTPTAQPSSALFRPGRIGTLDLEHRILMGSMHLGIEGERRGLAQLQAFYAERVRGGAALIVTGGVAVAPEGGGDHMYCLESPEDRDDLRRLADSIREAGGKAALQLFHSGRYARSAETGRRPVAPSAVASRFTREEPLALTADGVREARDAFVRGAAFARSAGFAAAEIMGSEGYLLNQFLSPLTNRRDDGYGGDPAGRMRLPLEIVREARRAVGADYPLVFRLSGDDCMEGGTSRAETVAFARELEKAGADALNVGIGWHESAVPTVAAVVPPAAFAGVAAEIRAAVGVPVIAANRIHDYATAEAVLDKGQADFVAPARPWLADPAFARKLRERDVRGLNLCLACNQACLDRTLGRPPRPVGCLVNPRAGRELELARAPRPGRPRTVAVVGGGVAGLEAAKTAAERGHRVTLYEAGAELGGQFRLASRVPGKAVFRETIRYYAAMLERLGVDVRLRTELAADRARAYERVVVASGVAPAVPADLPGLRLPHVRTYAEVLEGAAPAGRRVVLIGAGGIGCDLAHFLGQSGCEVHLVSRSGQLARGVGPTTRWVLLAELKRLGVVVHRGMEPREILPDRVRLEGAEGAAEVPADQVVLCTGQRPRSEAADALRAAGVPFDLVGGAADSRQLNAVRAVQEAFAWAMKL